VSARSTPSASKPAGKTPSRRSNLCFTDTIIVVTRHQWPAKSWNIPEWPAPPTNPAGRYENGL
jgi:hypothetical protein